MFKIGNLEVVKKFNPISTECTSVHSRYSYLLLLLFEYMNIHCPLYCQESNLNMLTAVIFRLQSTISVEVLRR